MNSGSPLVVKSRLAADLAALGVRPGQVVMLHASVSAVGWVVGGPDVVLDALLEVLGPTGTLLMYVSWEEDMEDFYLWSAERQAAYLAECPPFDPATSRAHRKWSILTEYLRTRSGAFRSGNPGASVAAVGARAEWITADHPLQYGYGPGSPLAKLCQVGGVVLLLGSPLDAVTLLHYSEHIASVPAKRLACYRVPLQPGPLNMATTLIIFSGLPGTGKTTLARLLATRLGLPLLAIDRLLDMPPHMLAAAYPFWDDLIAILLGFAEDQLALGVSVVIDSVFMGTDRDRARRVAESYGARFRAIHTLVSDEQVWRRRLADRRRLNPSAAMMATWESVQEQRQSFWPWHEGQALIVDALDPVEHNLNRIVAYVA